MPVPADHAELPSGALSPRRIEALWSLNASSPGHHIVLPDGRMDLVVPHRADAAGALTQLDLILVGPASVAHRVAVADGGRFLGLRFRAGHGGLCLGLDPRRLRDGALRGEAADAALGAHARRLRSARTVAELHGALVLVGQALAATTRGTARPPIDRALDLLHLAGGRLPVRDLARLAGLPERTLRRHVEAAVGLSVKALGSVLRFQRTLRLLAADGAPPLTLTQAALEGGYADQAHMTREFRRLGGFTPRRRPTVAFGSLPLLGLAFESAPDLAETFKSATASSL